MPSTIELKIVDDKVKVTSPYNHDFIEKCRKFHGVFKNGSWWFDDSIIDSVRKAMTEVYGTTGEKPYEYCTLIIKDFKKTVHNEPVDLFGRTIVGILGSGPAVRPGKDISFISGSYKSGGTSGDWYIEVSKAKFEINNFPLTMLKRKDVQKAIKEEWCKIKSTPAFKIIPWNDPLVYEKISTYAMNRNIVRKMGNPITTSKNMKWLLKYQEAELKAFCAIETTKSSISIKNFYAIDNNDDQKFEFIKYVMDREFSISEQKKLYCFFVTKELARAKKIGFKEASSGKNWYRLVIVKR